MALAEFVRQRKTSYNEGQEEIYIEKALIVRRYCRSKKILVGWLRFPMRRRWMMLFPFSFFVKDIMIAPLRRIGKAFCGFQCVWSSAIVVYASLYFKGREMMSTERLSGRG